ncbi:MAG: glycosyltransferase [Solirubrobacteraceae bacterium]
MSVPELSVVLPALGNYSVLRRVLDAYEAQDAPPGSFEVLVVADLAEPEPNAIREVLGERPYGVRLLTGELPGASANRNAGWRAARASIVLFSDSDTVPVPRLVSEHLAWHRRLPDEEVVVVGLVRWAKGLPVTAFMKWLDHGVQFDFQGIDGEQASWAHVYSANCSIKRSFLQRVGGYDEQRLPYGYEDLDWGYRAREHGLRVMLNRRAVVDHWRTMTVEDWQARASRLAVSEWRFCELHPDLEPWFHAMFASAASLPPGGRRSAALARFIPRRTPWIGRLVWDRASLHWRQQIAPQFLDAWDASAAGNPPPFQPARSAFAERARSSGGSPPGGPK